MTDSRSKHYSWKDPEMILCEWLGSFSQAALPAKVTAVMEAKMYLLKQADSYTTVM